MSWGAAKAILQKVIENRPLVGDYVKGETDAEIEVPGQVRVMNRVLKATCNLTRIVSIL